MRLETSEMYQQDEFEAYFARAALELQEGIDNRRGSLPSATLKVESCPRRTASCKFPSKRRQTLAPGSHSREGSRSPARRKSSTQDVSANESNMLLRAPSPKFESHSAPHSRSSSWKKMKRPRSARDLQEAAREGRSRSGSIPLEEVVTAKLEQLKVLQSEDSCVVRNFRTSSRGLVNRGDSVKRKASINVGGDGAARPSVDLLGNPIEISIETPPSNNRSRAQSENSHCSAASSSDETSISKVLILGSHGVGRTALLQQFMTSEYMGAAETSFDDECERTVSILLDGEETMIDFIDVQTKQTYQEFTDVDGYVLVYSITDKVSFQNVLDLLYELRKEDDKHSAVIVVANKSDVVRTRQVSTDEGKQACMTYDAKYIEVSAVLNHKVDELLAGVASQIRLNPNRKERRTKKREAMERELDCVRSAKGFLQKIFKSKQQYVSKSCDNLLVL